MELSKIKIKKFNEYDSRRGKHSYSYYTTGRDYKFELEDGREIYISYRSYPQFTEASIFDCLTPGGYEYTETQWENLPWMVRARFMGEVGELILSKRQQEIVEEELAAIKSRFRSGTVGKEQIEVLTPYQAMLSHYGAPVKPLIKIDSDAWGAKDTERSYRSDYCDGFLKDHDRCKLGSFIIPGDYWHEILVQVH